MTTAAQNMEFERAAEYQDLVQAVGPTDQTAGRNG